MSKRSSLLLPLLLSMGILHASTEEKNNIEVTAMHVEGTGTTFRARDGVVVYYQDSAIRADRAHYDKEKHLLVLDGNVEMIGYQGTKEHTSHLEIDTKTNTVHFEELFFTNENDIWLLSNDANRTDGNYTFSNSMLSSCDIDDPLWKMYFSDATYDSVDKYMKIYNAKVYFGDVPVFYTPYLAFSTDNQRESGLLFPVFGYSNNEGFLYEQPIYWAINESMDLELNPQIRINRSMGMYATYRFVDSLYSSGTIRAGYFKDKESFVDEYDLRNSEHYGLEVLYESSRFLSQYMPEDYTDGLYVNATLLNDIEYLNLQKSTLSHFGQVPLQESRLNYFLYNDDWYGGLNAKYFIDTRLENNDETVQTLPALQFHKYLKSLFWENLTYSLDLQTKRLDRKKGPTLNQAEFRLPIELTMGLFDDYLNITLGESLYYGRFFFGNDEKLDHDYFQYNSNVHTAKIFTDLTKQYDGFIHILQPSIGYIKPGIESQKPVDFDDLVNEDNTLGDLFSVGLPEERATFSINQYFYDENMALIFFQRLTQHYYTDLSPTRTYRFDAINNEMQLNLDHWQFYNNIYYSYEYDTVSESSSRITLRESDYYVSLSHTYKKIFELVAPDTINQRTTANDINLDFRYTLNERIFFNGGLTYSLKEEDNADYTDLRLWRLGGGYQRDCWSMTAQLSANIVPRAVTDPLNADKPYTQEYSFVFQLNFIPFASIGSGK
jgi:LPS-assembly protein